MGRASHPKDEFHVISAWLVVVISLGIHIEQPLAVFPKAGVFLENHRGFAQAWDPLVGWHATGFHDYPRIWGLTELWGEFVRDREQLLGA